MGMQKSKTRGRRRERRFRPDSWSTGAGCAALCVLEPRVLLSARAAAAVHRVALHARVYPPRSLPAATIVSAYNTFAKEFASVEALYVTSINEQSSSTSSVTAKVTADYTSGGSSMQVDNASAFFPNGSTTPVTAQASQGNFPVGAFYLTGYAGNTLFVSPTLSTPTDLSTGAILSATVGTSSQSSAGSIFPSYITNRTNQMAIQLVQYFNGLPQRLPWLNVAPHTPNNRGAVQTYVYQSIAGASGSTGATGGTGGAVQTVPATNNIPATSLQQLLLAIPLPTTTGTDLQIYNNTVAAVIQQSLTQTLNGVSQVYAGHIRVAGNVPSNRFGANVSGTVPAYITVSG